MSNCSRPNNGGRVCRGAGCVAVPRAAFTAIELVVVLIIMAILAATSAPKFADALTRFRADAAARRIVADLTMAQARAKATSTAVSIVFTVSPQASRYQIVGMQDPDRPSATYAVNLADPPYQAVLSAANLGGGTTLVYNGYGMPAAGGAIVVNSGPYSKTVAVDASTGMAAIQ